jgi:TrkA domain protein
MRPVEETDLPGVGTRFAFRTDARRVLGVIRHHDGRREVFVADDEDPDCVAVAVSLQEGEAYLLADLLGGTEISREVAALAQGVAGLAVDWVEVPEGPPAAGKTIGDLQVRALTGASIVAVLRGDDPHPAPGPGFRLAGGDVALVVGTAAGVGHARRLLSGEEAAP